MADKPPEASFEHEEGELKDGFGSDSTSTSVMSSSSTKRKKKRHSRFESLNEKMNSKFSELESKLDKVCNLLQRETNSDEIASSQRQAHGCRKPRVFDSDSDERDILSLSPGEESDSELDDNNNVTKTAAKETGELSEKTKKCLFDIFGEDAIVKKEVKKVGISIDQSQVEVLNNSFRCSEPNFLTAFSEENVDLFPVDETTEKFLEVPSLDSMVESCLVNRHGSKAVFSKSGVNKTKSLFSQPCKMVEKIAYRGQQAAKLGIIMQLYIQQSLANLSELLQSESFDKETACKQVKDIFAMSTKALDQAGRSGAFHHIVRRTVAMTDTGLYELSDSTEFSNLPLSGEGLFGSGLEPLLRSRKDKKRTMDELLPELKKKDFKRPLPGNYPPPKRQALAKDFVPSKPNWNNFRIPRVQRDGNTNQRGSAKYRDSARQTSTSSRGRGLAKPDKK